MARGENGADVPLAVVYHNAANPNFEIDVIDMRGHEPPYRLGEGVCIAAGSPYGCEDGERISRLPRHTSRRQSGDIAGAHGLGIEGIALHRNFVSLSYRADGQPHVAYMTKSAAAADFLAGRRGGLRNCCRLPWRTTGTWLPTIAKTSPAIMAKSCGPKMSPHGSHVIFRWC